jgi:hypothetical protein
MTQLAAQPPLTAAGTIVGTVHYMAPEQVEVAPATGRNRGKTARRHRERCRTILVAR